MKQNGEDFKVDIETRIRTHANKSITITNYIEDVFVFGGQIDAQMLEKVYHHLVEGVWLLNLILSKIPDIDTVGHNELSFQKKDIFKYYSDIQTLKFDVGVTLNRGEVPEDVVFYMWLCDSLSKGYFVLSKVLFVLTDKDIRGGKDA